MSFNNKISELSKGLKEYQVRPIKFLDMLNVSDWRIKLYGISSKSESFTSNQVDLASKVFEKRINEFPEGLTHHNTGFGIIHEGNDGNYIVFCVWIEENMIDLIIYYSNPENPLDFQLISPSSIVTCVWELEVLYFEKKAWVEHVLKNPGKVNIDKYLNSQFSMYA